jgi:hypothetical protein
VTENLTEVDQEGEMAQEQQDQSQESQKPEHHKLNSFWDNSFVE